MNTSREELMANGPIIKTMFALGIPTFIAQLVNLLYNVVDRMYIGNIPGTGAAALTGVGICFPILTLIVAFSSLIGGGGAPLAGIALGEGNREKAEKILGNALTLLVITSIFLTIFFQIIKKPFLYLFGASEATYAFGGPYLTIYLFGTVFVMLSAGLNYFISVQGATTVAMISVLIGAILNLILDPIFIFVFEMGVQGAAVATVISQAFSAVWVVRFLLSKDASLIIRRKNIRINPKIVESITKLGISPFIMGATESIITVVFNSGAQHYGNDLYVGSITIIQSVMQMICTPMSGFTAGVQPMISYNYGARNLKRVKQICVRLIIITFVFAASLALLAMFFAGPIAGAFTNDEKLRELCEYVLPIFICGVLVFGLQCGCQACFLALGNSKTSLFFALFRKVILLTPLAILLPKITNSVMGIYYAEPISDIISAVSCTIVFLITINRMLNSSVE